MKGRAPKSPATGSQVVVAQNPKPNCLIESHDSVNSTTPIALTITRTRTANAPVPMRKPRSPWLPRRASRGVGSGDTNLCQRRHLHLHDLLRQRRVAELGGVLLAVGERPLHELHHHLALRLVLRVLVEQQPGERGNRIGALALGVGD